MKRVFLPLLVAMALVSCESDGFRIKGYFPSAQDGAVVYMTLLDENYTTVDSAVVSGGRFEFRGDDCPARSVRMLLAPDKAVGGPVVLEKGVVKVKIADDLLRGGTDGNVILQRFLDAKGHLQALDYVTSPAYLRTMPVGKAMSDSLLAAREKARAALVEYATIAIAGNVDNELGRFLITRSYTLVDVAEMEPLLNSVPEHLRDARYNVARDYTALRAKSERQKRATAVGKSYLNFELTNLLGEKVLFSSVVEKNNYTLLQFWASWCAACRADGPRYAGVCKKYAKNGAGFVGVSLDADADEWRKAVTALGLGGVQLCNPSGGSAEVASEYGVAAVPANVLVNREGTIIARDLSVEELESLLAEAVKK